MRPGEAAARALVEFQETELRRQELKVQRRLNDLANRERWADEEEKRLAVRMNQLRERGAELDRINRHLDRAAKMLRERRMVLQGAVTVDLGEL